MSVGPSPLAGLSQRIAAAVAMIKSLIMVGPLNAWGNCSPWRTEHVVTS
jgi:hypothetical protein